MVLLAVQVLDSERIAAYSSVTVRLLVEQLGQKSCVWLIAQWKERFYAELPEGLSRLRKKTGFECDKS
jgi:hypothetical protein